MNTVVNINTDLSQVKSLVLGVVSEGVETYAPTYVTLNPITSLATGRYGRTETVEPEHMTLVAGLSAYVTTPDSAPWKAFFHPEGQRYYYKNDPKKLKVVTEENMDIAHIANAVSRSVKWIEDTMYQRKLEMPDSAELFVQLANSEELTCNYYFVDHASRTEFWLEPLPTEDLGLEPAVSLSHAKMQLENLYWIHVEYFPMHAKSWIPKEIIYDIIDIFSHGQADRLSSSSSAFPYTAAQSAEFLVLLNSKRDQDLNGYTICYVARMWGAICHHRFSTYYGQDLAQLDRGQAMVESNTPNDHWLINIYGWLLWNIPHVHLDRLQKLFVDDQVYIDQWRLMMTECLRDWSSTLSRAFPVLIANVLLCMVPGASIMPGLLAIVASCLTITSGSVLLLRHQKLEDATASTAAVYLRDAKSNTFGFVPSAVIFSLPGAFYIWSIVLLSVHIIFLLMRFFNIAVVAIIAFLMIAVICTIVRYTAPEDGSSWGSQLLIPWSCFDRTLSGEYDMV